jgi:alpha-amylase
MATKFFSDGAVHSYFNPYETPYDAFMNYMNVLSDFEIRLRKYFPDTAEQELIFNLGSQLIEKDMIIEKQAFEIEKLTKKSSKIKSATKLKIKKEPKPVVKTAVKKPDKPVVKKPAKKSTGKLLKAKKIGLIKTIPKKLVKTTAGSKK